MVLIFKSWDDMKEHIERFGHLGQVVYKVDGLKIRVLAGSFACVFHAKDEDELEQEEKFIKRHGGKEVAGATDVTAFFANPS